MLGLENTSLENVSYQQYSADLSEKCRKALELRFGEIPMPNCFAKKNTVVKARSVSKRKPNKNKAITKRKIVIKFRTRKNVKNTKSPIFF